ncbi:hypothetical protein [Virgibacillus salexigens]|nr:hypothetical protein [Virgibacillus massiliensis]
MSSTTARRFTNPSKSRSAKKVREDLEERKLRAISKSIDISKLKNQEVLPVDKYGNVEISPDHPHYKYWTEDD